MFQNNRFLKGDQKKLLLRMGLLTGYPPARQYLKKVLGYGAIRFVEGKDIFDHSQNQQHLLILLLIHQIQDHSEILQLYH